MLLFRLFLPPLLVLQFLSFVEGFAPPMARSQIESFATALSETTSGYNDNCLEDNPHHHHARRRQFLTTCATTLATTLSWKPSTAHAAAAKGSVDFTNVKNGDTVPQTFLYKFEVNGYELSPAKDGLKEGTGHHHLVIDGKKAFVDKGTPIPFDDTHKHYGKAQTEGELELSPGRHKLTLQFANANHESYGKEFAKTITINVKDDA